MCAAQFRRHGQLVVEVGEAGVRVEGAGVEDGLRGLLDPGTLRVGGRRPREVVVDDVLAVAIIALQPPADRAHPRHVDVGFEDAEMIEGGVGNQEQQITCNNFASQEAKWDIPSAFRGCFRTAI